MEEGAILIVGVGGIGCIWATQAHSRCQDLSELLLIDADESSFEGANTANCLFLDAGGDEPIPIFYWSGSLGREKYVEWIHPQGSGYHMLHD